MWQEKRDKGGKKKEALCGMFWSVEEVVGKKEEGRKKSKGTCVEEKKKKGKKLMKYG